MNEIGFDSMNYINQNHRINKDGSYKHLYKLMSDFIMDQIPTSTEVTEEVATEE